MRASGLDIVGDVPWGTHFCQFYSDKQDLLDALVPYFSAGLANNECCIWVASAPLAADEAAEAMRLAVANLEDCVISGQMKFIDHSEWYTRGDWFDGHGVVNRWIEEMRAGTARGFDGLRISGNTSWLASSTWADFTRYEAEIDAAVARQPMLALCTYDLDRCGAVEIVDVVSSHAFALIKRAGTWELIGSARRRAMEAALRASEDRYRSLFECMTEGFARHEIVCDAAGEPCDYRFLDVNPAFERLTGLDGQNVVGRRVSEVLPAEDPAWVSIYGRVAMTGEAARFDKYAPSLGRHYQVFAYRPAPRQFAVLFLDVTEQKQTQQRLEEANRLKDEFLATLSHELQTPLNAIVGWAELLSRKTLDAATVEQAVQIIVRNAHLQAKLVSEVLEVASLAAGKVRLEPRPLDLANVAARAIDVARPSINAKDITIAARLAPGVAIITGDSDRLHQVACNLLSNAVKFTPPGGRVDVEVRAAALDAELIVRDSGCGIGSGFLPCIFEPFRQADGSSSRLYGGLGVGLTIARHLVELHGGTVGVESDGPDRGATFTVRLPLCEQQARAAARRPPRDSGAHLG